MMKTIRIAGAALFLFSFAFVAKTTHAQTDNWTGALSHDWFTEGNWDTDNVPTAADNVRVDTAPPSMIGVGAAMARSLSIGTNSGQTGEVDINGITAGLATSGGPVYVGNAGTGTLSLNNSGLNVNNNNLYIGEQANSNGTMTVSNNSDFAVIDGQLIVGDAGNGTLTETETPAAGADRLEVGRMSGSSGQVVLDHSYLGVNLNAVVGDSGTGTWTIQNGSFTSIGAVLEIGNNFDGVNNGTGTVTVTGENAMGISGQTNSSFLQVTDTMDVGAIGTGTLNVLAGGEADANNIRVGRDAGSTGNILVDGVGALSGVSSLLHATNDLAVGGTQGGPGGDGTLTITNHGVVTVDNNMWVWGSNSNTGTLAVDSTYTLNVTNTLDFDGGILHFLGNGTNFTNDAYLGSTTPDTGMIARVDGSNTGTISSVLSGPGGLIKDGTGTLILTNANTYNGTTYVDGGVLQIDGAILSNQTYVNAGALTGTGIIEGNVTNSATVSPGHGAIGTLSLDGLYEQEAGGTFQAGVAGLSATEHNMLSAGSAELDGTLQVLRLNNFSPMAGDRVTIISDPVGGHTGTFSNVTSTFPGLIQPVPMYNEPDDVYIVFELSNTFLSQALTRNQRAVATDVDSIINDPRETALITYLSNEPVADLPHDYDLIAPEELTSIYEIGFSQAAADNMNLMHRMDDIRSGSTGYSGPVVEIPTSKDEAPISDKNVVTKNVAPAFVPCPENRWGIFAVGSGDFVNVGNEDDNAHGYDLENGSMLLGVDYRFGEHVAIGIDGEYANDIAELVDNGRVYADGGKAGAFATVYGNGWLGSKIYVDLAGNGGWNSYDAKRVGLANVDVRGSTDGTTWNGMLAYGADWTWRNLTFGTWSSLQYTDVQFDHFTEHGSLAPLEFPDQDEDSFRTTSGVRASYDVKFGQCGVFRPEVRVAWQHEYGDEAYPIDSQLASGAGSSFRVWGPAIGRDAALVDAGITLQLNSHFSTFAFYDGVLGRSNYDSHAVSGGVRVSF